MLPNETARNMRDRAVELARQGFRVFPLKAGTKDKPLTPWQTVPKGEYFDRVPSGDPKVVYAYWSDRQGDPFNHNIGICTNDLLVIDVDNKNDRRGDWSVLLLGAELGLDLNKTLQTRTPTGGRHLYYKLPNGGAAANTVSKLGDGIDTRGWHGYVVAPGSVLPLGEYKWVLAPGEVPIAIAPEALLARCLGSREPKRKLEVIAGLELDSEHAIAEANAWLLDYAPEAIEGAGGDAITIQVANAVGDLGISESMCLELMLGWNELKASPPWPIEELEQKVANAYAYRQEPIGCRAPEAQFEKVDLGVENEAKVGSTIPPLTLSWWAGRDLPEPEFICGQWLTTTSRVILNAPTGLGKSVFTVGLGMAIAAQKDFLHWKAGPRPVKVLYIDGEMSNRLLKQRLADEVRRIGCAPETFYALSHEDLALAPLNTPQGQKLIDHAIEKLGGIDLIQFDNVMSLIPGDQKEEEGWAKVLPWIRSLTRRGIGQMWVHHTGHNKARGYGTSTREWQLDTVLHLTEIKRPDTDISFEISFSKARERTPDRRADFVDKRVALLNDQWTAGAGVDFEIQETNGEREEGLERLTMYLDILSTRSFTRADVDVALGVSHNTARRRIEAWLADKSVEVEKEEEGKPTVYTLPTLPMGRV